VQDTVRQAESIAVARVNVIFNWNG